MAGEHDQRTTAGDDDDDSGRVFDQGMLSDLFVNAVPILIMGALLVGFQLLAPGSGGEPLLGMHLALVGGVVVVSYVAARVIAGTGEELQGPHGSRDEE